MLLRGAPAQQHPLDPAALSSPELGEVAVLGLGYVGLPIARAAAQAGFRVTGIDPCATARSRATASGIATALPDGAAPNVWIIAVPTPLDHAGQPDLRPVQSALATVARHLAPGALVLLISTCHPGATRSLCAPGLEAGGLRIGRDIFLAVSPERENPGAASHTLHETPRLVGALDDASLDRAVEFWARLKVPAIPVATAEIAECAKLLENTYRLVNIALMGEMQAAFAALGVPTRAVVEAAATKPFGFAPFWPGLGAGGHCIPVDPAYLQREARAAGAPSSLITAALRANAARPAKVLRRLEALLGPVAGRRIMVAGITYKPDVADLRGSAPLALLRRLHRAGADAAWHDPMLGPVSRGLAGLARSPTPDAHPNGAAEALILGTPHSSYDLAQLARVAPLVLDPHGLIPGAVAV